MKKLIVISALALGLGACSPSQVNSVTATLLHDVEQITVSLCRAVPEATAIISLVNAGIGQTANALATAFCASFQTAVATAPPPSTPAPKVAAGAVIESVPVYKCTPSKICGWQL